MADFALAWNAGASQPVSGFLTKGVCSCTVVESVCLLVEGKSRASYSTIFLMFPLNILPPILRVLYILAIPVPVCDLHYKSVLLVYHLFYFAYDVFCHENFK